MCTSTKPMKRRPLTAIAIFSVIVERDDRVPVTRAGRVVVATSVTSTTVVGAVLTPWV